RGGKVHPGRHLVGGAAPHLGPGPHRGGPGPRTRRTPTLRRPDGGGQPTPGCMALRELDPTHVYEVLPALHDLRHRRAGSLSGGQQQMVAVGRALMARPDVIAVDELSLGLAPIVVDDLIRHLIALNGERGTSGLLIEQTARLAFESCSRAYV